MLYLKLFGLNELYIWPRGISKNSNRRGMKINDQGNITQGKKKSFADGKTNMRITKISNDIPSQGLHLKSFLRAKMKATSLLRS